VLVNLTWLVPGVVGGSEESTTDAMRALLEHRSDIEPTLAVQPGFAEAHADLAAGCRCEVMERGTSNKVSRVVAEQTWLPAITRRLRPDVTHHGGGVLPLAHPGPTVLTIHDLQPLDMPGNFTAAKRFYMRAMLGRSTRSAGVVCVPSEFTAARVMQRLGVPRERIVVVPWTVVRLEELGSGDRRSGRYDDSGRTASSGPPVFVYPAITYPHKNHLMLLDAFARLLSDLPDAELVLPGGAGPTEGEVARRVASGDLRGNVQRPGRLSTAEMERLYRRATAVVVPSTYEGFGLPALEAMLRGVPLLVADAGSLPEVVAIGGSTATAVPPLDPGDPGAWAAAMLTVARLPDDIRLAVSERQRRAAARFTPRLTADALAGAYRRAARRQISSVL
jgi:alpha-1,3-rhamnosyl/mannosyltransferase